MALSNRTQRETIKKKHSNQRKQKQYQTHNVTVSNSRQQLFNGDLMLIFFFFVLSMRVGERKFVFILIEKEISLVFV